MVLKFRHIDTQQTLNTIKFSADSTNTTYFLHSSPSTQSQGTPDVNYEDICFIKLTGQEYTHGKLYGGENDNKATALLDEYLNKTKLTHSLPQGGIVKGIILDGCELSLNYNTNNQPNGYKISNGTIYLIGIGIVKITGHRVYGPTASEQFIVYGIHETSNTDKTTWDYHIYGQTFGPEYDSNILNEGQVAYRVCRSLDLYRLSDLEVPIASDLQNGLMSKEDKKKLDNHTDEYLDYLHTLCTEHSKYAIILSGCTVEPTGVQDTYQRKGGYVYIDSINQIKKVNDGTISHSTTIEDSLYCNSQNGGNGKTYAFGAATNPSNLDNKYAKVCDWADLARLSDLEVPVATNYQNGLITANEKNLLQGLNNYSSFAVTYGNDKYCQFYKNGAIIFIRGYLDVNKSVVINNVNSKYHGLIPCSYDDGGYKYNPSGAGAITFTASNEWGTLFVLARYYDAINNIDDSDITITNA